jgi:hypothetical protein
MDQNEKPSKETLEKKWHKDPNTLITSNISILNRR